MLSKFENFVIRFVRVFFLLFAFVAFISLVFSTVVLATNLPKLFKDENSVSIKIDPEEVEKEVQSKKPVIDNNQNMNENNENYNTNTNQNLIATKQDPIQNYTNKIMLELDKKFKDETGYWAQRKQIEKVIKENLSKISEKDIEDFVNTMLTSIKKAPKDEVFYYIDGYFNLYFKKYDEERNRILSEKQNAQVKMLTYLGTIGSSLMLLISSGIILILAAIERNTRQAQKNFS